MLGLTIALVLAVALPANAATKVKGKLSGANGITVLGVSESGSTVADRVGGDGRFALRFEGRAARRASLQLISRSGSYRGPIVIARERRRAYTTLTGRARKINLKTVKLLPGYAITRKRVSKRALRMRLVSRRAAAKANRRGKPLGAGKLGLVKVEDRNSSLSGQSPTTLAGEDEDGDGIPNVADADDNGNGVIDQTDPAAPEPGSSAPNLFSSLPLEPEEAMNANAAGVTPAQIDSTITEELRLAFVLIEDGDGPDGVTAIDVDCFRLAYCRVPDGTALVQAEFGPATQDPPAPGSRWVDYDPNGDGLPNLVFEPSVVGGPPGFHMVVQPAVPTSAIQPGDSFGFELSGDGARAASQVLTAYFVSTPALVSFDGGGGPTPLTYPVQPGDPGTSTTPAPLASNSVRLRWWRPQRPAIPGAEDGDLIDMGGLFYGADVSVDDGTGERIVRCLAADWSDPSAGLELGQVFGPDSTEALTDTADDATPNPDATLAATLDLGSCLQREGIDPTGKRVLMRMIASTRTRDNASQFLHVQLPG